ncbi:MAG: BACON domain-containing protein [Acidobacteria bacterium]|nr:BACON domain-containing protein [Acidobacteriota bacterium]
MCSRIRAGIGLILSLTAAFSQTTVPISGPSGEQLDVRGINKAGDVVGVVCCISGERGFVRYADGAFRFLDFPGAAITLALGMSESGDIVGAYGANIDQLHGFLRDSSGNFTSIDHPGAVTTIAYGINKQRQIVGSFSTSTKGPTAFVRAADGTFADIPSTVFPTNLTGAYAVNDLGQIIGRRYFYGSDSVRGANFLRQPDGTITEFEPFYSHATYPRYWGLNNKGVLVGTNYQSGVLMRWGEQPVTFTIPDHDPPMAINDAGQLGGRGYIVNPCSAPVSPMARSHGGGAEAGALDVQPSGFCPWYAEASAPWITFTASVGAGSGKVHYSLSANAGAQRTGTITVAGTAVTITQAGSGCTYSSAPSSVVVAASGGGGAIGITTQDSCLWQASTTSPWVIFSASGTGSGSANYTVQANTTAASRTAVLNIGGQSVNLQQTACAYTLGVPQTVPAGGGTQTIPVGTTCSYWLAWASVPWVTINWPGNGTGPGSFSFSVGVNPGVTSRTATITVGTQSISIVQAPSGTCLYQLNPTSLSLAASASASGVSLVTGDGCPWTATTDSDWIRIEGSTSGAGSGTINVTVVTNTTSASRTGALRVGSAALTITQAAALVPAGLRFVPLPPCRVMETRGQYNFEGRTGSFGPPALNAGEYRTLDLPASNVCSIPSTARAYVLNVTLIPVAGVNYATVSPAGETRPNVWTIRSPDGQVVANSTIVGAGSNGRIAVYTSDASDVVLDISGYFVDSNASNGLAFYPMTPCRVGDTRSQYRPTPGPFGPPALAARETRKFRIPATPYCQVPQAAAYSMTLTVLPGGPLAYLTAWPDGNPQPNVSNLNALGGRVLANNVIVPAGPDGTIDVFASDTTDLVLDINGYFAPDDGRSGLFYFPVTQCRVSDSTSGAGAFPDDTARTIHMLTAACPYLPAGAQAYAINVTALPNSNAMPFLSVYPTGQPRPNASILNSFQGQIVTNSAIVPAGTNGAIDVYVYRRTDVVVEISGYFGR